MALEFVQVSTWLIPRQGHAGGDDNGSGDYMPVPAGGVYFYTDLRALLSEGHGSGEYYWPLWLPKWFPNQALLSGIHFEFGYSGPGRQQVNISIYVDVLGKGYRSGTPPGAEIGSDFTRDIMLCAQVFDCDPDVSVNHVFNEGKPLFFDPPIPLRRDNIIQRDHLVVSTAHSAPLDWFAIKPYFLVPAPFQPKALGTGY